MRLDWSPGIGAKVLEVYVSTSTYTVVVGEKICNSDVELLSISLHPFYLPREFQQLFYMLLYIHTQANESVAAQLITDIMHTNLFNGI